LEIGFYRDLAVGSAPDGAESWAHDAILARGVTIGAPPDPFSAHGQNWNLPAPNPLAGAREGWTSLSALYRANMRHAGMLRIDHAMGLQRLFLIPAGAKPAEGAYLSYPVDDLIGHIALESQRARCMVIGEDLGTVPEGFRDRMTRANIQGMRVLWFERDGPRVRPPQSYPPQSVACVATHDLATLAGWWRGSDIAERLSLGLLTLARAGEEIARRRDEKRGLIAALVTAGLIGSGFSEEAPLSDTIAAAVHALVGGAGSILAHAQFDDLVGETVQTNLPGTDRERPNWRIKLSPDVAAAFARNRAQAILAALAKGRT
jgi:glycogen operon protein